MEQLVQVAAPVGNAKQRSMHVFVCLGCREGSGSWRVFRSQEVEERKEGNKQQTREEDEEDEEEGVKEDEPLVAAKVGGEEEEENPFAALIAFRDAAEDASDNKGKSKAKKKKKKPKQKRRVVPEEEKVSLGGSLFFSLFTLSVNWVATIYGGLEVVSHQGVLVGGSGSVGACEEGYGGRRETPEEARYRGGRIV